MKRLLVITAALVILFSTILTLMLIINTRMTTDKLHITPEISQACPQSCWHGIQLGKTSLPQAGQLLYTDKSITNIRTDNDDSIQADLCWSMAAAPTWRGCLIADQNTHLVTDILWLPPSEFRLGDAIALFGRPTSSFICGVRVDGHYADTSLELLFGKDAWLMAYPAEAHSLDLDPNTPLTEIDYFESDAPLFPLTERLPWVGFTRMGKNAIDCGE